MGADSKRAPPLPAPTETDTTTPSEVATDLSKPGDEKSSYSIPEDGTPVTIRTRGHKASKSQTSLLIEYFEGGKSGPNGQDRKPSVRVRLTPSKKSKGDHIQVTETKGSRKASLTRRIPLDQAIASREIELHDGEDANSMTSYASATEESNVSRNPIDIEIDRSHRRRRPASPLIPSAEPYQPGNPSEISAIPTDSFLDGSGPAGDIKSSSNPYRGEAFAGAAAAGVLAGAAMGEISNNKVRGKERVKIADKPKDKYERRRQSKSRASSVSSEHPVDEARSPRRPSRSHQESNMSALDSSVVSSHLAPSHRSIETRSSRSGASKSSINNPKLLETVEDAIRRLILPELSALKREQSKRESRRGSLTSSVTSGSREDVSADRRRSSSGRAESSRDGAKQKERRNREARHDYDDEVSLRSPSRDSIDLDFQTNDGDATNPKRSNNLLKAAAAGAAGAALAKGVSSAMEDASSTDRKHRDRRRRRADHARSRSLGRDQFEEELEEEQHAPAPPMPLMSDINPSELTRTSILSAESERPHSASEELAAAAKGFGHDDEVASGASTPTRAKSPINHEQHALAMHHANVSHGDLTALPRGNKDYVEEYETDEYGRKIPIRSYDDYQGRGAPEPGDYPEDDFEDRYYSTQDVPPPLCYVPYQAGARGLSPIPSVSGYTEAGSEAPLPRDSTDMPSPSKSPERTRQHLSLQSDVSMPGHVRSQEFDRVVADGREQFNGMSSGQAVRGLGANPNFVSSPIGVESAVASLVDGSMLDQSVVTGASGYEQNMARDSTISYDEQSKAQSSRGVGSVEKMDVDDLREPEEERQTTPGSKSVAQSQDYSEYEVDEYGRKVPRAKYRHSPTASEAAITAGAVGAAAAALKAAKERKQAAASGQAVEDFQPAGVARNRSFKERTMHHGWEPRNTPTHSIDRLDLEDQPRLGASGMPDMDNPMPEIGYLDDELQTNPSLIEERLDGEPAQMDWSGRATPTQQDITGYAQATEDRDARSALGITEAIGAAALGAAAGMAATHSGEGAQEPDEWHRTSDERKRDTLVTNPYEDASPIVNPELNDKLLSRGLEAGFSTGSPGIGQKYDEGYMSNGPNRTPDLRVKGKAVDFNAAVTDDDPFYVSKSHARHMSGMSQGMASPFYDAATGAGIERIENKDIIALMQHLMVRDAQRSARDTEIVALLMNAALEMRNSFREMKELVQDTGDDVIFANVENTEKLQKAISGPRPYLGAASRSLQSPSQAGTLDEAGFKKKNLWKRALQGLSAKGTNDLTRIEDMLMQLLGEVDQLKTQTAPPISTGGPGQSFENIIRAEDQLAQDKGYEPERVSTPTHANEPGVASVSQSRVQVAGGIEQQFSEHRISTVPENEEEYQYKHSSPSAERSGGGGGGPSGGEYRRTPSQADHIQRSGSVPLETPPRLVPPTDPQPQSAENTPRTDKGKKHKSSSSSGWLPKISRWSGTTASSVGKAFRGSSSSKKEPKYDDFQPPSRSGSSLASYDDDQNYSHDPYGEDLLHTGFSDPNLAGIRGERGHSQGPPPTSFMTPEDPKYKAHRNSLNLQHPQPRPGQTERFRTALESSAQEYNNPMTPRSTEWAGSATSLNRLPPNSNRYSHSHNSSGPSHEADHYSPGQQSGPPRPPKEPIESPTPQTPPKSSRLSRMQKEGSPVPQQSSESGYGTMTGTYLSHYSGSSPKLENRNLNAALGVPSRRPSGPRAMTPKSPEETAAREERRRKRDTFGTVASEDTDTF